MLFVSTCIEKTIWIPQTNGIDRGNWEGSQPARIIAGLRTHFFFPSIYFGFSRVVTCRFQGPWHEGKERTAQFYIFLLSLLTWILTYQMRSVFWWIRSFGWRIHSDKCCHREYFQSTEWCLVCKRYLCKEAHESFTLVEAISIWSCYADSQNKTKNSARELQIKILLASLSVKVIFTETGESLTEIQNYHSKYSRL